jgi:AcrR family transcriptional regulator
MTSPDDARVVLPDGVAVPARIPAGIFAAAVDTFVAGQRLDMRSLGRRLGVARATLYRRAGNREQLLDELLWWRARRLLVDQVQASAGMAGTGRLVAVIGGVLRAIARDRPLRAFLESDPETALRLLTGARSTVHRGMAGWRRSSTWSAAGEASTPAWTPRRWPTRSSGSARGSCTPTWSPTGRPTSTAPPP